MPGGREPRNGGLGRSNRSADEPRESPRPACRRAVGPSSWPRACRRGPSCRRPPASGRQALYRDDGRITNSGSLILTDDTVSGKSAGLSGGGIANRAYLGAKIVMDNAAVTGRPSTSRRITQEGFVPVDDHVFGVGGRGPG
jgi:hypothetical protein